MRRPGRGGASARRLIGRGLWPLVGWGVGDERAEVHPVWDFPVQLSQQVGVEEEVEVGHAREVGFGQALKGVSAGERLQALAGWRLFPDSGSDRPLGVEQRTEPAARQDAEREPLAARSEAAQIERGTPGHLYQGCGLPGFL